MGEVWALKRQGLVPGTTDPLGQYRTAHSEAGQYRTSHSSALGSSDTPCQDRISRSSGLGPYPKHSPELLPAYLV
eukprot:1358967-Rhodomonas_salina.2